MFDDKTFVDTNIIIYAYDVTAGVKHQTARRILKELWESGLGVLSTQILQEFFVNVVQKIPKPIDVDRAEYIVKDFLAWEIVVNDGPAVLEAITICKKYKYSFWDSLVINAAVKGGAKIILTEDLSEGQVIEGIRIQNPFNLECLSL